MSIQGMPVGGHCQLLIEGFTGDVWRGEQGAGIVGNGLPPPVEGTRGIAGACGR